MKPLRTRGFTLLELMIAVAVLGILTAIAYPAYTTQITKGRRADAKTALVDLAQRMERYYTERSTYVGASLGAGGIYPATSPQGHYNLAIAVQTAAAFAVTATPTGVQSSDHCGTYRFDQLGTKSVGGGATLSATVCW